MTVIRQAQWSSLVFITQAVLYLYTRCYTGFTCLHAFVRFIVCLLSLSRLSANKKKSVLESVFVPRASLAHGHLTWICVAKAMPCFSVQLNAQLHPLTLGCVLVAMVTASGVTVNEKSALDGCTMHFSLCLCIKLRTLLHLFTMGRLTRSFTGTPCSTVIELDSHRDDTWYNRLLHCS